jgi:hypothetical protein
MAFDRAYSSGGARQRLFTRPRRRPHRVWVVVGIVGAFFVLAWLWAFQRGPDYGPQGAPLIRAEAGPTRVKPDNAGGLKVPDIDPLAYDAGRSEPKVEHLTPLPETPLPQPATEIVQAAPPAPAEANNAALKAIAVADNSAVGPPVRLVPDTANDNDKNKGPAAPKAAPAAAPKPAPAPAAQKPTPAPVTAAAQAPAKPKPAAVAPAVHAAAPPKALPMGEKGVRVQLASLHSDAEAKALGATLKRTYADLLGPLSFGVMEVDLGDRGHYFRVMFGPMTQADATRICDALKQRGAACLLAK